MKACGWSVLLSCGCLGGGNAKWCRETRDITVGTSERALIGVTERESLNHLRRCRLRRCRESRPRSTCDAVVIQGSTCVGPQRRTSRTSGAPEFVVLCIQAIEVIGELSVGDQPVGWRRAAPFPSGQANRERLHLQGWSGGSLRKEAVLPATALPWSPDLPSCRRTRRTFRERSPLRALRKVVVDGAVRLFALLLLLSSWGGLGSAVPGEVKRTSAYAAHDVIEFVATKTAPILNACWDRARLQILRGRRYENVLTGEDVSCFSRCPCLGKPPCRGLVGVCLSGKKSDQSLRLPSRCALRFRAPSSVGQEFPIRSGFAIELECLTTPPARWTRIASPGCTGIASSFLFWVFGACIKTIDEEKYILSQVLVSFLFGLDPGLAMLAVFFRRIQSLREAGREARHTAEVRVALGPMAFRHYDRWQAVEASRERVCVLRAGRFGPWGCEVRRCPASQHHCGNFT